MAADCAGFEMSAVDAILSAARRLAKLKFASVHFYYTGNAMVTGYTP